MEQIEKFGNPPKDYSVLAFWFLNGELREEELRRQIRQMTEKGVYGGFLHPRAYLKTPYLEKEWWDMIDVCLDESRRQGYTPWLYDEYAWPSGTAGSTFEYGYQKPSRTLASGTSNMAKGLYAVVEPEGGNCKQFLAEKLGETQGASILAVIHKDHKCYTFYQKIFPKAVDYLNPETIAQFIRFTHEEYKKRYQDDFGTLIPGIFFDEIYMMGNPIPWTEALPKQFEERYGYSLLDHLISLIEGEEESDQTVRLHYFTLLAQMYENAFFKQISDWCRENHLKLTGHTEEFLWEHARRQGNYFKTMRHLMIPGSDNHDYRYHFPRKITYCEPKYSVSVARAYHKERAMAEAMGGAGWCCSLQEFKRGINTLSAMGTNLFILHGFYYECEHQGSQSDWPTSFFYQNPYWKYFKQFADYIRRICYWNSQGRPVVNYGIYYPIEEMQQHMVNGTENPEGQSISQQFHAALTAMIEHQMDTDMIDSDCLEQAQITNGRLCIGQQQFQVLLLPQGVRLSERAVQNIEQWMKQGGIAVFYQTDSKRAPAPKLAQLPIVKAFQLPQYLSQICPSELVICSTDSKDIYINHREIDQNHSYFITNSSDEQKKLQIRLKHHGKLYIMDPETGEKRELIPDTIEEAHTYSKQKEEKSIEVSLTLYADQAIFLFVEAINEIAVNQAAINDLDDLRQFEWNRNQQALPQEITRITGKWSFLPLPDSYDSTWGIHRQNTQMEIPLATFTDQLSKESRTIRIANTKQEKGRIGRHVSSWQGSWITRRPSWNDQLSASDLYFRKCVTINDPSVEVEFCIATIDSFILYVNGTIVKETSSHGIPVTFEVKDCWIKGENLIAVHVHNSNPLNDVYVCSSEELPKDRFISLLLEARIHGEAKQISNQTDNQADDQIYNQTSKQADNRISKQTVQNKQPQANNAIQQLISDQSWIVNDQKEEGWNIIRSDVAPNTNPHAQAIHCDVLKCLNFNEGLPSGIWLNAWERGKPPMLPWGDLPLYGQITPYPVTGYYTITIPSGTCEIAEPQIRGSYTALLDGRPIDFTQGAISLCPQTIPRTLTLTVQTQTPEEGLQAPLQVEIAPILMPLMDWRRTGLEWFSGRAQYTNTWNLPAITGQYELDLGSIHFYAEIWINGQLAGTRLWPPYRLNITPYLVPGQNTITIITANSAANARRHMLVDEGEALGWNQYWNQDNIDRESQNLESGLLGPIHLIHTKEPNL